LTIAEALELTAVSRAWFESRNADPDHGVD
jgi:hypothetical protein